MGGLNSLRLQANWINEKAERLDAFQRELQKKSDEIGDFEAEKVNAVDRSRYNDVGTERCSSKDGTDTNYWGKVEENGVVRHYYVVVTFPLYEHILLMALC